MMQTMIQLVTTNRLLYGSVVPDRRFFQIAALVICVMTQFTVSAFAPFGLSICRANDGHVALEMAHDDGQCLLDLRRHHPDGEAEHDSADHGCSDTKIAAASGATAAVSTRDVSLDQGPVVAMTSVPVQLNLPVVHLDSNASRIPPSAGAALRLTTVLLI